MGGKGSGRPEPAGRSGDGRYKSDGGCFIATAVYGGAETPQVLVLRKFRDQRLLTSYFGQLLVRCYYAVSPPIAKVLVHTPRLSAFVRRALDIWVIRLSKK
jgi:hypothetical protein